MLVAKYGMERVKIAGEAANGFPIEMIRYEEECKPIAEWLRDTYGENCEVPF